MIGFQSKFDIGSRKPYIVTTYILKYVMGRLFSKGMLEQKEFHYHEEKEQYIKTLLDKGYTKIK